MNDISTGKTHTGRCLEHELGGGNSVHYCSKTCSGKETGSELEKEVESTIPEEVLAQK